MKNRLLKFLENKKILILGFGREGKSTYNFIRNNFKDMYLYVADQNEVILDDDKISIISGEGYLDNLNDYDIIIKTPGVSFKDIDVEKIRTKIFSQLELFLKFINVTIIGITGTKGKSTTSSLIYKIIKDQGLNTLLLGNIGVPFFDFVDEINKDTVLVVEMSSHQLEYIDISPTISIITNLFQEHLDHYNSYEEYIQAKLNICRYQNENDYLIYNKDNDELANRIDDMHSKKIEISINDEIPKEISNNKLIGNSAKYNIRFSLEVARILNLDLNKAIETINKFEPLPHRMEYVGKYQEIYFYDDAIATIPEATINSIEALKKVDTLIFGGLDRGIDLTNFINYLNTGCICNLICMPTTGHYVGSKINNINVNIYTVNNMEEAVNKAFEVTEKEKICLLAPAAASYGYYKNFEEKGNNFQELIKKH